jgi:quercetin dioxygenase-like cupin family protein
MRLLQHWRAAIERKLKGPSVRPVNRQVESLEADLLKLPQIECPLVHRFAPGVYLRQIFMPAGSFIIGHCHKTEHFNIVMSGRALVMMEGQTQEIAAPSVFVSQPGVRKVLRVLEDMVWMTVHVTPETDLQKLEEQIITKSPSFLQYHQLQQLREHGLLARESPS